MVYCGCPIAINVLHNLYHNEFPQYIFQIHCSRTVTLVSCYARRLGLANKVLAEEEEEDDPRVGGQCKNSLYTK
jgi:hypothetical protein